MEGGWEKPCETTGRERLGYTEISGEIPCDLVGRQITGWSSKIGSQNLHPQVDTLMRR